jgi:ribonuclease HI
MRNQNNDHIINSNEHEAIFENNTNEALTENEVNTCRWNFITQNVHNLYSHNKQAQIINYVLDKKPEILGLTETWHQNDRSLENWIQFSEIKNEYYLIGDGTSSRNLGKGIVMILKKSIKPYIVKVKKITSRLIALNLKINGKEILIMIVNMPHRSNDNNTYEQVQLEIRNIINSQNEFTNIIIMGDWNATMNPSIDRDSQNSSTLPEMQLLREMVSGELNHTFEDLWRIDYPEARSYTHNSTRSTNSRIDFTMTNINCRTIGPINQIKENEPINENDTDHKAISVSILLDQQPKLDEIHQTTKIYKIDNQKITEECKANYNKFINDNYNNIIDESNNSIIINIIDACTKSASENLPGKWFQRNQKQQTYIPKEHKLLIKLKRCNATTNELIRINRLNKIRKGLKLENITIMDNYNAKHKETKRKILEWIDQIKQNKIRESIKTRAQNYIKQQGKVIASVLERKRNMEQIWSVKETIGQEPITDPIQVKNITRQHWAKIMSLNQQVSITADWEQEFEPKEYINASWYENIMKPLGKTELFEYIKALPNKKATGPSGLANEHLKFLEIDNPIMNDIQKAINTILETGEIPECQQLNLIIPIPKSKDDNSILDNWRPITLIETIMKLVAMILGKRTSEIFELHDVLKGDNYAFRKGRSTNDPLQIIRNTIDDAKLNKKDLFIAQLDVQQAYDSVPFEALRKCMERIKLPQGFINLILNMHKQRHIIINTAYGNTDEFNPTKGLPQGNNISTVLWNIFYDPLTCRLESETSGYIYDTINAKITSITYADDLHLINSQIEEIHTQLALVYSYLKQFKMKMRPKKCKIITNRESVIEIREAGLNLGGELIDTIMNRDEPIKILGVNVTLNGNHQNQWRPIMDWLQVQLNILKRKAITGIIAREIINLVIIPTIVYRLQISYISTYQIGKMEEQIRNTFRLKMNIPKSLPTEILYSKSSGLGLKSLKVELQKNWISNTQVGIQSHTKVRQSYEAVIKTLVTQKWKKVPFDPLEYPVSQNLGKTEARPFILHVSQILKENNLELRTNASNRSIELASLLTPEERGVPKITNEIHAWKNRNIPLTINAITKNRSIMKVIDLKESTPYNLKPYYRNREKKGMPLSNIYPLIRPRVTREIHANETVDEPIRMKKEFQTERLPLFEQELHVWTDGSLIANEMGAAAVFVINHNNQETEVGTRQCKIEKTNASSTKAELAAFLMTLRTVHKKQKTKIYTDSQTAIEAINSFASTDLSLRSKIKLKNHSILDEICFLQRQMEYPIEFIKVKAHTGLKWNERADTLAKEMKNECIEIQHNDTLKRSLFFNGYNTNDYAGYWIKKQNRIDMEAHAETRLQQTWPDVAGIDMNATFRIMSSGRNRINAFDSSTNFEHAFRIKLLYQKLPVLKTTVEFTNTDNTNPYCRRCKEEIEDIQHLFNCTHTIKEDHNLYNKTINILYKRINPPHKKDWVVKETIAQLVSNWDKLVLNWNEFIQSPYSKGIITKDVIFNYAAHNNLTYSQARESLICIADAWLSSFYKIIYSQRNNATYFPNNNYKRQLFPNELNKYIKTKPLYWSRSSQNSDQLTQTIEIQHPNYQREASDPDGNLSLGSGMSSGQELRKNS